MLGCQYSEVNAGSRCNHKDGSAGPPCKMCSRLWRLQDRLPVNDGVPEHALVAPIEIAMQWIEIERDDVAAADWRV